MMAGESSMWFGGGFMWIFWLIIIAVLVMLFKSVMGNTNSPDSKDALEILNQRFARGEIDEEEYKRRRKLLE